PAAKVPLFPGGMGPPLRPLGSGRRARQADAADVVEHGVSRTHPPGDLPEHLRGRRPRTESAKLLDELANALVARSPQAEPLRLGAEAAVNLCYRNAPVVEPGQRGEEAW